MQGQGGKQPLSSLMHWHSNLAACQCLALPACRTGWAMDRAGWGGHAVGPWASCSAWGEPVSVMAAPRFRSTRRWKPVGVTVGHSRRLRATPAGCFRPRLRTKINAHCLPLSARSPAGTLQPRPPACNTRPLAVCECPSPAVPSLDLISCPCCSAFFFLPPAGS
jgi:hypothetical protein